MVQPLKEMMVGELKTALQGVDSFVVVDFGGLGAVESTELRSLLRQRGIRMRVVHNRLMARVSGEMGISAGAELFDGQCAVVYGGEDIVILSQTLRDWMTDKQKLAVRGGLLQGRRISAEQVAALAAMPPRKELYAQIVGMVVAPVMRLAFGVQSVYQKIGIAIEEIRKQKESSDNTGAAPAQS